MNKPKKQAIVRTTFPAFSRARRYEQFELVPCLEGQLTLDLQGFYKARTCSTRRDVIETKRTCRIQFCSETERWLVHGVYARPAGLHCGACFEILIEGRYFPCRIEWDGSWLVVCFKNNVTTFNLNMVYSRENL